MLRVRDGKVWVECEVLCKKLVSLVTKAMLCMPVHAGVVGKDLGCC